MTYNIGDIVKAPSSTDRGLRNNIPPEVGDLFRVTYPGPYNPRGVAVSGRGTNDGSRSGTHEWYLKNDWEVVPPSSIPQTDRPFIVGDRVHHTAIDRDGTIREIHSAASVEVAWDDYLTLQASTMSLRLIAPEAPASPVTETLNSVWGVGNTIEFTVTGAFTGTNINVGCQSIRVAAARSADVLREMKSTGYGGNWDFTFRVKLDHDYTITHPGGSFTRSELARYGRDFKLIEKAPEPEPEVTITITADEAARLRALTGQCNGSLTRVYGLLGGSRRETDGGYRVYDVVSGRLSSTLTLRK